MDSDKIDNQDVSNETSELVGVEETATENAVQVESEPTQELNSAEHAETIPCNETISRNSDNDENDVILIEETSSAVDNSENIINIEPIKAVDECEASQMDDNSYIEKASVTDATETESTEKKFDDEPMDIDEILESLTDHDTVASTEGHCDTSYQMKGVEPLQLDVASISPEKEKEDEKEEVVLLSDDEKEIEAQNQEVKNDSEGPKDGQQDAKGIGVQSELVVSRVNPADLLLESASLEVEISAADAVMDVKSPLIENDITEVIADADVNVDASEDVVENMSQTSCDPVETVEKCKEIENNTQQEVRAVESINIFDLLRENEDLFGKVDACENGTQNPDLPMINKNSESQQVTLTAEDEKKGEEPEIAAVETEIVTATVSENIDTATEEEPTEKPVIRRECLNIECRKKSDIFLEAPEFVINHFHLNKRSKVLYVCEFCYDTVTESYETLCAALVDKQPLFLKNIKYSDLVEIIDSSDEEDETNLKNDENIEKMSFDAETLAMIENELDSVIKETLQKVDINQQMDWNRQILKTKINKNEKNCAEMMNEMKVLQSRIDKLYTETYNFRHNFIEEVQSLDLTTLKPTQICNETYPPTGELKYSEIEYNSLYYTFRSRLISRWMPCKVTDKIEVGGHTEYGVKFCREKKEVTNKKSVLRKHLAYGRAPDCRLNIGTRVIALFDDSDSSSSTPKAIVLKNNFYPGVIAEPLSLYTNWRYLVFFDDGWVQYVHHENIRVVCEATENVWELIEEPGAKTFIEGYVKEFKKKRPIVQVRQGQRVQTEFGGKWYPGIVNNVDGSLVQIFFEDHKRYEWIYRGSTRLFPLYKKLKHVATTVNRNEAAIEYIVIDDDKEPERSTEPPVEEVPTETQSTTSAPKTASKNAPIQRTFASQAVRDTPQQKQREQKRAVAKKSTAPQPKPAIQHMNNSTIYVDEDKPKGKVVYYTAKKHIDVKKYINHECQPSCLVQVQHNLSSYSPLSKPLLLAFERQICKTRFNKKFVVYRAPCGRRLRDMYEMHKYLRMTNCLLNVDNFTFDPLIHCLAEYVIESHVLKKADLSGGIEKMPVQLINCYDTTTPPPCMYSAKRIPTEGVNLSTDVNFLCGCDCTDDCLDKTKCQCWQLTLQGAKYGNPDTPIQDVGYEYKRLNEPVPTGIYECNAQCKCKSSCLNRVVQHPLQLKLQVFKTVNRGWGLRCLNDVPKGSFICCYAGNLLTETAANEAGEDLGDEYFAELDYIEVVENMKEGYEPEVVNDENESSGTDEDFDIEKECRNDDSDDEFVARAYTASEDSASRRYRTRNSVDNRKKPEPPASAKGQAKEPEKRKERNSSSDEEGDLVRQVKNFMASNTMPLNDEPEEERGKSIRKLFGKNEAVYIMDAKKAGNIGRYFNHSCGPNLFVQNVFVDTHDLRFPWVAFFASTHIRAGTELTWNYNYEVGSVPGKVLICQCGDEKCRGRIL